MIWMWSAVVVIRGCVLYHSHTRSSDQRYGPIGFRASSPRAADCQQQGSEKREGLFHVISFQD
jgi:hypothetical protein